MQIDSRLDQGEQERSTRSQLNIGDDEQGDQLNDPMGLKAEAYSGVLDGEVMLTPVELGTRNKELVEVTSGLKEGDQLVVYGHSRLHPDESVVISGMDN